MERITVKGKTYLTNIVEADKLEKCKKFFSEGCTSYAVSFNNLPKSVITKLKVDKFECYVLRDFNFNYRFIPERAKEMNTAKELLESGLDLIELI